MPALFGSGRDYFERRYRGETLRVEAWSRDCIRVRATLADSFEPFDWAINAKDESLAPQVAETDKEITLVNGRIGVAIDKAYAFAFNGDEAPLRFFQARSGRTLLEEKRSLGVLPDPGHSLRGIEPGSFRVEARFRADPAEKLYGLGHNQNGFLNLKGCVLELRQMNSHTVVPVTYSSKGYGFFWNNPAYGRVELAANGTYWVAEKTDQLDYFVLGGGTPAEVAENYARLTGFPTMMPDWAMGFWQCKLRYRNRDELMETAREHKKRGLPMSVIVIDFFHWAMMGEWDFDPKCWPDPEGMLRELKEHGHRDHGLDLAHGQRRQLRTSRRCSTAATSCGRRRASRSSCASPTPTPA